MSTPTFGNCTACGEFVALGRAPFQNPDQLYANRMCGGFCPAADGNPHTLTPQGAYACAECGTTEAQTYVVTQLDPTDDSTRTEVCRRCDDELRLGDLLAELLVAEQTTRPPFREEHWDRDEEEADVVADVYLDTARKLMAATALTDPTPED